MLGWDWVWTGGRVLIILEFLNTRRPQWEGGGGAHTPVPTQPGPSKRAKAGEEGSCSERDGDRKGGGPALTLEVSPEVKMEIHPEEPGTSSWA